MKGFYIEVSNGLLEPKHREKIGSAVWEFMWLLDKITKIDDDGDGWVLGGKPITCEEIVGDLGIVRKTVLENLHRLRDENYISLLRTPHGLQIKILKAKKRYNQKVTSNVTKRLHQSNEKVTSNIRQDKDSNSRQNLKNSNSLSSFKRKDEDSWEGVIIDYDNQNIQEVHTPIPRRDQTAFRLNRLFLDKAEKATKIRPVANKVGYKMLCDILRRGDLTEAQIEKLYDWWFKNPQGMVDEMIQVTRVLSANNINRFKALNKIHG